MTREKCASCLLTGITYDTSLPVCWCCRPGSCRNDAVVFSYPLGMTASRSSELRYPKHAVVRPRGFFSLRVISVLPFGAPIPHLCSPRGVFFLGLSDRFGHARGNVRRSHAQHSSGPIFCADFVFVFAPSIDTKSSTNWYSLRQLLDTSCELPPLLQSRNCSGMYQGRTRKVSPHTYITPPRGPEKKNVGL